MHASSKASSRSPGARSRRCGAPASCPRRAAVCRSRRRFASASISPKPRRRPSPRPSPCRSPPPRLPRAASAEHAPPPAPSPHAAARRGARARRQGGRRRRRSPTRSLAPRCASCRARSAIRFARSRSRPASRPSSRACPYFYVRGAPPGNVGYFFDGVRVPYLFHFGLGPSVIHPALVARTDIHKGGYPAALGRYAGGIVDVEATAAVRPRCTARASCASSTPARSSRRRSRTDAARRSPAVATRTRRRSSRCSIRARRSTIATTRRACRTRSTIAT